MKKGNLIDLMLERDKETDVQKETQREKEYAEHPEHSVKAERPERKERQERAERSQIRQEHAERGTERAERQQGAVQETANLDSGQVVTGILEVLTDGYGFIRSDNYLPGENDIYINPAMIRRYNLKTGDILCGNVKIKAQTEKFSALLYVKSINGFRPDDAAKRRSL